MAGADWERIVRKAEERIRTLKEAPGFNLKEPRNREEQAVVLDYRNLIEYVLSNLAERLRPAHDVPSFTHSVEIVVAGGTSLVGGFVEVFAEELKQVDFPLKVSGIRRAEDPLTRVARGCLIAAVPIFFLGLLDWTPIRVGGWG